MDVSDEVVGRVPGENLHVSRASFAAVWSYVEVQVDRSGPEAGYLAGVRATCRWLAAQQVLRPGGGREVPPAPASGQLVSAMPERIEAEFFAAVGAAVRRRGDVEWARGVLATLEWAWHGSGRAPVELPQRLAG